MASHYEQRTSSLLRTVLAPLSSGSAIPDSEGFRLLLSSMEFFVPEVLSEIYPEWKLESLDGVMPLVARKVGNGEVEIFGLCIIISDQTTTPVHLRMQVCCDNDEMSWLDFKVGEVGEQGMLREGWRLDAIPKRLHALEGRADKIEWYYTATFGQRSAES